MSLDHPFSTTEIGDVSIGSIFLQCLVATGDDRQDLTLNNCDFSMGQKYHYVTVQCVTYVGIR